MLAVTIARLLLCPASASLRQGRLALLACGVAWALLSLGLDAAGHAPTRAPLPRWYLLQAVLVVPWVQLAGALLGAVARRLPGVDLRGPLGVALGLPILFGFVLPDALLWGFWGFEALWPAMLGTGAVTVSWSLGACLALIRERTGRSWAGCLAVVLPAWLAQAAFCSLLLR